MRRLQEILDIVVAFEKDEPSTAVAELKAILVDDMHAENAGFPVVLITPDEEAFQSLYVAVIAAGLDTTPVNLPCYRAVESWTENAMRTLERSRIVVASTTAQQLLPRALSEVLNRAGEIGSPILIYVTSMGRARDPEAIVKEAPRHIGSAVRNGEITVTCIGDMRYQGPSLDEAIRANNGIFGSEDELQQKRRHQIESDQKRRTLTLLLDSMEAVRLRKVKFREETDLLCDTEHGLSILARAEAHASAGELRALRDEFLIVDSGSLWVKVSTAAALREDKSLLVAYMEILEKEVSRAFADGHKRIDPLLEQRHQMLSGRIRKDLMQAQSDLVPFIGLHEATDHTRTESFLNRLGAERKAAMDHLEQVCKKMVAPESLVVNLMESLRQSKKSSDEPAEDKSQKDNEEKSDQGKRSPGNTPNDPVYGSKDSGAEKKESEPDLQESLKDKARTGLKYMINRLEPMLERVEEAHLRSETERIFSDIAQSIDRESEIVAKRWEEQFQDYVSASFQTLHGAVLQTRNEFDARIQRLTLLEKRLDD